MSGDNFLPKVEGKQWRVYHLAIPALSATLANTWEFLGRATPADQGTAPAGRQLRTSLPRQLLNNGRPPRQFVFVYSTTQDEREDLLTCPSFISCSALP